jgi:hypothetical protein
MLATRLSVITRSTKQLSGQTQQPIRIINVGVPIQIIVKEWVKFNQYYEKLGAQLISACCEMHADLTWLRIEL